MMKRCGFTLIELLVVVFILALIFTAIFSVFSAGRQSWHTGSVQVELQQETRKGMDRMVKELRESGSSKGSSKVSITGGGSIITFQVPVDCDNDGDVVDSDGNIEWGAEANLGWSIQYSLNYNRQLVRKVLNGYPTGGQVGADVILAHNIYSENPPPNALMFIGSPAGSPTVIHIEVTAQKDTIIGRTLQSTLHSQVNLRNLKN